MAHHFLGEIAAMMGPEIYSVLLAGCGVAMALLGLGLWLIGSGCRELANADKRYERGLPVLRFATIVLQIALGFALICGLPCCCLWKLNLPAERESVRSRVVVGLSENEVRAILGRPDRMGRTSNDCIYWAYSILHGEYGVVFDADGRVAETWIAD